MNFFTQELQEMTENCENIHQPKFVGQSCIGKLTDDVTVKLEFAKADSLYYDCLRIRLINRHEGEIDSQLIHLRNLWKDAYICNTPMSPGYPKGKWHTVWGESPRQEHYQMIAEEIDSYLECFMGMEQEESESMNLS